jgi:hypothetical protein
MIHGKWQDEPRNDPASPRDGVTFAKPTVMALTVRPKVVPPASGRIQDGGEPHLGQVALGERPARS